MKQRILYGVGFAGGVIGMAAAFVQTIEKIELLKNKDAVLSCNLNSVFSCTNVLNAWQSSVFGFPNSLMCLTLFTIFTTAMAVGLSGGKLPRRFRLGAQTLSLFTLGFGLWFLAESIYVIGALCILCIFCMTGLLAINWAWLRLNAADLPIGKKGRQRLQGAIKGGYDTLGWVLLAALLAFAMLLRFS